MSDAIRDNVNKFLADNGFTFSAVYCGETVKDNNWKCDAWRITLKHTGTYAAPAPKGKADFSTDYFTGTGLRKKMLGALRPVEPSAADVVHSLLMDADAINESFHNWCDNLGMDSDSIKALSTYNACCAIGQEMRKLFTTAQRETLRDMLQDY